MVDLAIPPTLIGREWLMRKNQAAHDRERLLGADCLIAATHLTDRLSRRILWDEGVWNDARRRRTRSNASVGSTN